MRKSLLLLTALAMSMAANAQGLRALQKAPVTTYHQHAAKAPALNADDETASTWWGYFADSDSRGGLGVKGKETYDCAIFIPGTNPMLKNNKITAIKVWMTDKNFISNLKVWVSKTLPASADKADYVQDVASWQGEVTDTDYGLENTIELTTPYSFTTDGVYVGYSFTVGSTATQATQYPIAVGAGEAANSMYLKTSKSMTSWEDVSTEGYGKLALQVKVEGMFPKNSLSVADFGELYAGLGSEAKVPLTLTNYGQAGVKDFDYVIATNGTAGEEKHHTLATPYNVLGGTFKATVAMPADVELGTTNKTITITKVNGVANEETATNVANGTLKTVTKVHRKNVLVEEFTGTDCGFCPRGLAGMKKLRHRYGNRFVGVALHWYNYSDPMYLKTNYYARLKFEGAPQCEIDRGKAIDPFYGSGNDICDDFEKAMKKYVETGVNVTATWNDDSTEVTATAHVESNIDNANFNVAFVLIGDSLRGNTSSWMQNNNFAGYTAAQVGNDEYLAPFCQGGEYGKSPTYVPFDDVALASSYQSGVTKAPAIQGLKTGEEGTSSYTMTLPTKLASYIHKDKVAVVAIITDNSNNVVNAAKTYWIVSNDPTGVSEVKTNDGKEAVEVARYNAAGQQINGQQSGLNIVKYSDGTTRKVVVK